MIFDIKNPRKFESVNQTIARGYNTDGINIVIRIIGMVILK